MREDRLLRLAEHLEVGKLWHDEFNFTIVSGTGFLQNGSCGTIGCAIGECRFLWPEVWEREPIDLSLFEVTLPEWDWLFFPMGGTNDNCCAPWNEQPLMDRATQYEVAQGIRNFIAWKKAQAEVREAVARIVSRQQERDAAVPEEELVGA